MEYSKEENLSIQDTTSFIQAIPIGDFSMSTKNFILQEEYEDYYGLQIKVDSNDRI